MSELVRRVGELDRRVGRLEERIVALEKSLGQLDARVAGLDRRVDDLGHGIEMRFSRLEGQLVGMRADFGAYQRTIIQIGAGVVGTLVVGILGLIATQI